MFSVHNILKAFEQGVYPDLIGTDIVGFNFYKMPCMSMPFVASMLYNMGMPMGKIFEALTTSASKAYQLGDVGTLENGKIADIALFKFVEKDMKYDDKFGGSFYGKKLFAPMATVKEGRILYQNLTL